MNQNKKKDNHENRAQTVFWASRPAGVLWQGSAISVAKKTAKRKCNIDLNVAVMECYF